MTRMYSLIKLYHVVQELYAFSLTDHGRMDSHSDFRQTQLSCNIQIRLHVMSLLSFNVNLLRLGEEMLRIPRSTLCQP